MPFKDALRGGIDCRAIGDVAFLVLVGVGRGAREPDRVPPTRLQRADEFGADA